MPRRDIAEIESRMEISYEMIHNTSSERLREYITQRMIVDISRQITRHLLELPIEITTTYNNSSMHEIITWGMTLISKEELRRLRSYHLDLNALERRQEHERSSTD